MSKSFFVDSLLDLTSSVKSKPNLHLNHHINHLHHRHLNHDIEYQRALISTKFTSKNIDSLALTAHHHHHHHHHHETGK